MDTAPENSALRSDLRAPPGLDSPHLWCEPSRPSASERAQSEKMRNCARPSHRHRRHQAIVPRVEPEQLSNLGSIGGVRIPSRSTGQTVRRTRVANSLLGIFLQAFRGSKPRAAESPENCSEEDPLKRPTKNLQELGRRQSAPLCVAKGSEESRLDHLHELIYNLWQPRKAAESSRRSLQQSAERKRATSSSVRPECLPEAPKKHHHELEARKTEHRRPVPRKTKSHTTKTSCSWT